MDNELVLKDKESELTPIEIALQIDKDGRTSAKKLYEYLELNQSNYSKWCKSNIINNAFATENVDYWAFVLQDERNFNPNPTTDYKITANFAKKLALTCKNKKGEDARNYFIKVEDKLKEVAKTMQIVLSEEDKYALRLLHTNTKEEMIMLIKQHEEEVIKPLKDSIDRYERFLCEKTELLKKSDLATKLDTNTGTLAALFKKLDIYTPKNCKLTESFLEKFPNVKMFDESDESYTDKKTGKWVEKKGWQWTFLGSKSLVDYLIGLGHITFTENDGFKLKKA